MVAEKDALQTFFREVYKRLPNQKSLRHLAEIMSLRCSDSHILLRKRHSFHTMLRVSQSSGVSLVDILQAPRDAAIQAGDLLGSKVAARQYRVRYLSPADMAAIEKRLKDELSAPNGHHLANMNQLARELGVDVARIGYHFPQLHRSYMLRRQRWLRGVRRDRERRLEQELSPLLKEYPGGKYKTIKQLETALMEACDVGRKVARQAISCMLAVHRPRKRAAERN